MRRLLIPLILILTIGSQLLPAIQYPTLAQSPTTTLRQNFDDLDEIEYTLLRGVLGSGDSGQGVRSNGGSATSPINDTAYNAPLHIILTIPEWCTLQSITWRESGTRSQTQAFNQLFWHRRIGNSNGTDFWFTLNASFDFAWRTASIVIADPPWNGGSGLGQGGALSAGGEVELFYGGSNTGDTLIFDTFEMTCGGAPALVRPFSATQENPDWGLRDFDIPGFSFSVLQLGAMIQGQYDMVAGSVSETDYVLAPASGQVLTVEPIEDIDCGLLTIIWPDKCLFLRPKEPSDPLVYVGAIEAFVFDTREDIYKVGVLTDNGYLMQYIVSDADSFVHPGLVIDPSCILGRAVAISGLTESVPVISALISALSGFNVEVLSGQPVGDPGVTIIRWLNPGKGLDLYTEYGNPDKACNGEENLATCITFNPNMRGGDGWTSTGAVTWSTGDGLGTILQPGSSVLQTLTLTDIDYSLKVWVTPVFSGRPDHRFRIQLGTLAQEYTADGAGIGGREYVLTGNPDTDYGGMGYTVNIANIGGSAIIVKYACVEEGTVTEPTTCTFTNPTFENDLSGWTPSNGTVIWRNGSAFIPIGQNITQGAPLPPGDYVLDFDVRIAFDPATYTGGGAVSVNVYRPDGASGNYPLDIGWNQVGGAGYPITAQRLSITFAQIAPAGNFVRFEPVLDTSATGILGIWLDRACLYLTTQGPSDGGGQCARPSSPINSDVGAWTSWHWANLNRFFTCELMITLNSQYDFIQTSTRTGLMSVRWFMASMNASSAWMSTDLFPWLNGHFRNIALGQVTTINQQESGGAGIWDVLLAVVGIFRDSLQSFTDTLLTVLPSALGLLYSVAQIVFTVILGAISFVLALVTRVAGLMNMAGTLLGTIVTAYNTATPISIPLLPQCSAVDPRTQPACVVFWMLDNTLFSGLGEVYVPLILSILSIHLVLNIVIDIRKTVIELGKVS